MKKKQYDENRKTGFDWSDPENTIESAYFKFQIRYGPKIFPKEG